MRAAMGNTVVCACDRCGKELDFRKALPPGAVYSLRDLEKPVSMVCSGCGKAFELKLGVTTDG
jgi:hypothetical protein